MNETVLDERGGADVPVRAATVITARSLLLRLLIAIVTIATLSIGGAWLMYATIDPAAEASEGVDASIRDGAQSQSQIQGQIQPGSATPVGR